MTTSRIYGICALIVIPYIFSHLSPQKWILAYFWDLCAQLSPYVCFKTLVALIDELYSLNLYLNYKHCTFNGVRKINCYLKKSAKLKLIWKLSRQNINACSIWICLLSWLLAIYIASTFYTGHNTHLLAKL